MAVLFCKLKKVLTAGKWSQDKTGQLLVVPFLVYSPKRATSVITEEILKYAELYNPHEILKFLKITGDLLIAIYPAILIVH